MDRGWHLSGIMIGRLGDFMKNRVRFWEVRRASEHAIASLTSSLGVTPLLAQLLYNRGLAAPEAARDFLDDPADRAVAPAPLPDLSLALERLVTALENDEPITA